MSTSLAVQLQRLAVPQTSTLTRDKKRPSLLFDQHQAAELTREAFYQIGLNGFEELKQKSSLFEPFGNTLFHATSKGFERSVQDATANERLNKQIKKFFLVLSPYFLLTSAHKALEWLINRYSIQEYNKRDFLMLILPYHETNIFVRALQLIRIKDSGDSFIWLKSLQKTGAHLPKNTLFNHVANDSQLLKEIGDFVLEAIKEHDQPYVLNVLFNFYTTTFTGALEYGNNIGETHITHILSVLLKGQKSSIPDFCAGSYIVTAKLLSKTELSEKILNKFLNNISLVSANSLKTEAVLLLVVLYQTQKHFIEISDIAVKNLANKVWIPRILEELNGTKNFIDPFLIPLFQGFIKCSIENEEFSEIQNFTKAMFNELKLEKSFVSNLISIVINVYKSKKKTISKKAFEWIKNVISTIETQYPTVFDKEANAIMKIQPGDKLTKIQKCFQKLVMNFSGIHGSNNMFDKLYHPVPDIRRQTIKFCVKKYKNLKEREQELLRNAILDRLNDENPCVVFEILHQSKKLLAEVIEKTVLKDILIKILKKSQSNEQEWWKVSSSSLSILCNIADENDVNVFMTILPFLLPLKQVEMKATKIIINSPYCANSKYFRFLNQKLLNKITSHEAFFDTVMDGLKSFPVNTSELIDEFNKKLIESDHILTKYLSISLLCNSQPEKFSIDTSSNILSILTKYVGTSKLKMMKIDTVRNSLLTARQNRFPLQGILSCIEILIAKTEVSILNCGFHDFSYRNNTNKFYVNVLNLLLTGCYTTKQEVSFLYGNTLKEFMNHFCSKFKSKIEFLLNLSIANNEEIDSLLRLRCLRTVNGLIKKYKGEILKLSDFNEVVVLYLLNGLLNTHQEIRISIVDSIKLISANTEATDENYICLLKNILNYKDEILLDNQQISVVINNIYERNSNLKAIKGAMKNMIEIVHNKDCPLYLRGGLVNILISIDTYDIYNQISKLGVELLEDNIGLEGELKEPSSTILHNLLVKLHEENAKRVNVFSDVYKMFNLALPNDSPLIKHSDIAMTPSALAINHIQRNIFENFNQEVQLAVLNSIVGIATITSNTDVITAAGKMFKHIDLDASLILQSMTEMVDVQSPKVNVTKRKRRVSIIPTADILETMEWRKGVTILEFLQDKKKVRNSELLIPLLFKILKKCLDFDEQSNVEYPKQLILSTLLNCCTKIESNMSESVFNVEVVIQCIRASQNPQTHHHALLVLAYTANLIPKQVLHHIMAIFTFMGSSVLRHDDAYSFQIINKIIDTIIPILVEDNSLEHVVSVLRVFVDAILDVPEHRRMALYTNLMEKIDAKNNLYLFMLLMLESHVLHANIEKQKSKETSAKNLRESALPKLLDITADISRKFPPEILLENCIKLIAYMQKLPEDKKDVKDKINLPFDITHQSPKQYRHFKYVIVTFISSLLSSKEFVHVIAGLSDEDQQELETLHKNMIIGIVTYIQGVAKITDRNRDTPQTQYWKVILHHSYDVLDSVNALLTPQMFLLVIRGLTTHHLNPIRRRSLELLNNKLQHDLSFFDDCSETEMHAMIPPLLNIIKQTESEENEIIVQTAFLSLKLFVKRSAKDNPEKFVEVLNFVTNLIKTGTIAGNILASAVLCLAELCSHLRAHAVSNLNKFMPSIVKMLKIHRQQEYPDLLLLSILTAVLKILECLPLFLSSYLEKILCEFALMYCKWCDSNNSKLQPVIIKLTNIKQKIGTTIPSRVLIPVIDKTYHQLIENKSYSSIGALMDVLSEMFSHLQSAEIQSNLTELTGFFLKALQFRVDGYTTFTETNEIEKHIVGALVTFILKLSESTFRPLYYKIYDWAVRHDVKNERVITFYSFSSRTAESLKSLFVLFAGHFLNNAASMLDSCNVIKQETYFEDIQKTTMLLECVLKTLHAVFLYDTQKFINKDRFDVLMQPIVDQLENTLDSEEALISRSETLVIPCLVQFAIATGDDSLWKQLNYQILLKMRHSSSNIRLVALKCVLQLASKLGEDFLPLLPETIPFLAELLEDEDEIVEKTCQRTVQELEKVLGEPLQKYF